MLRREFNFSREFPSAKREPSLLAQNTSVFPAFGESQPLNREACLFVPLKTPDNPDIAARSVRPHLFDRISRPVKFEEMRSEVIGAVRQAILDNAGYLDISAVVFLTTELTENFLKRYSTVTPFRLGPAHIRDLRTSVVEHLVGLQLMHNGQRTFRSDTTPVGGTCRDSIVTRKTNEIRVVITKPIFHADASITIYATVHRVDDAVTHWSLSKGNSISHSPVSLQAMYELGSAATSVVWTSAENCTLALDFRSNVLEPQTQYSVFLSCTSTKTGFSATDSLVFLT